MAKVTIEVLDAVVDGKGKGEKLSVEEASANYLVKIGYAKKVTDDKETKAKEPAKKADKPAKSKGGKTAKK